MNRLITIIPISDFNNSKTRLSPFLSHEERKELLKSMLKDIILNIQSKTDEIIITSKDKEVLNYAKSFNTTTLKEKEHETNKLNSTLIDTINYIKNEKKDSDVLLLPSDIPLIKENNMDYITKNSKKYDIVITPSGGGGTNLLYMKSNCYIKPEYGEFSFFKHIESATKYNLKYNVYDSFYLSIDINTPQDLGELLLHGKDTNTYEYLNNLGITVKSKHGQDRLDVQR